MEYSLIIFVIIFLLVIIEIIIRQTVLVVNKKFQWLIIQKDEIPTLSIELKKFLEHGYDKELGWVRKPNTEHMEVGKYGQTKWTINEKGCRTNPNFDENKSNISCYGDSFTFSRQVNDDETWEHFLSEMLDTNVQNFGVGNYGIDQALLRMKREFEKNKTPIVILSVVPDTISRINSIWKHYSEYGNTFGFKPRFIMENENIKLIKNFIDNEKKFQEYKKYLPEIKKLDYFYERKFVKEKIYFPYLLTILKNFSRNFGIIFWILTINLLKKMNRDISTIEWKPMQIIMRINLKWRVKMFEKKQHKKLLKEIVRDYVKFAKAQNFKPILILLPQKDDILFIKKNYNFYKDFLKDIEKSSGLYHIDVTNDLLNEPDLDCLYSDDNEYGGHYSKEGNKKIAEIINKKIMELDLNLEN
jgi:hypothetical protein